jgi:hypothetical protein
MQDQIQRFKRTHQNEAGGNRMKTEASRDWFKEKNERRTALRRAMGAKAYNEQRKQRRSLLNGAFGNKEKDND